MSPAWLDQGGGVQSVQTPLPLLVEVSRRPTKGLAEAAPFPLRDRDARGVRTRSLGW